MSCRRNDREISTCLASIGDDGHTARCIELLGRSVDLKERGSVSVFKEGLRGVTYVVPWLAFHSVSI
jgi:hypothetical protein